MKRDWKSDQAAADVAHTSSWIFLAIALASQQGPAKIQEISTIADGINHAVPTQYEMQIALASLLGKVLIEKTIGNKYQLTPEGKSLYEKSSSTSNRLLEIWKYIEQEFSFK